MMLRRKISKSEVSQSFNLKRLLGYSPSERQKELFFEMVKDKIVSRTAGGKDINEADFLPYEPEYAKKKGVSMNAVDLILEGDMLKGIQKGSTKDIVKLEMESDETAKAFGHISGMEGHPTIKEGKVRDFFGIKKEEDLKDILAIVDKAKEQEKKSIKKRVARPDQPSNLAQLRRAVQETISISINDRVSNGEE